MNIKGMNKAKILAGLYNGSRPLGMGFLHYILEDMTEEQAQDIISTGQLSFDYFCGRIMKVDLSGDELETSLYNRDNGEGKAEKIIGEIV